MTEQDFTWSWDWFPQIPLDNFEEWERIVGENWFEFTAYNLKVPVYKDGKPIVDANGALILKRTPLSMMAFIYIMKKVEDPSWTFEQTRKLPGSVIEDVFKDPKADNIEEIDAEPKSEEAEKAPNESKTVRRNKK